LKMAPFDRPYTTFYWSAIVTDGENKNAWTEIDDIIRWWWRYVLNTTCITSRTINPFVHSRHLLLMTLDHPQRSRTCGLHCEIWSVCKFS